MLQEPSLLRGDSGGVGDPQQQPLEGTPRLWRTALGETGGEEGLLSLGSCPEAGMFCHASSSSASIPRLQANLHLQIMLRCSGSPCRFPAAGVRCTSLHG